MRPLLRSIPGVAEINFPGATPASAPVVLVNPTACAITTSRSVMFTRRWRATTPTRAAVFCCSMRSST